ncbi:MAG: hypothetical protein V4714_05925 [Bacteroidota bacterium]
MSTYIHFTSRVILRCLGIFLCLVLFNCYPGQAQLDQTIRKEFVPKNEDIDDIYDVIPFEEKGLILSVRNGDMFSRGERPWTFHRYDTSLHEIWTQDFLINSMLVPLKMYHNSQYLFILLSEPESLDISVFRLSVETGEGEMVEGSLIANIEVSDFKVLENQAYIAGMVKNRPVVIAFSLFDKRPRVLPGLYGQNSEINGLQIDELNRTVSVIMYATFKNTCKLVAKTYSYEGKLLDEVAIKNEKDYSLVTGKISKVNPHERLLMGNYSIDCSPYSQGLYLAKFNNEEREFIHYFKFADFKNFFNYMKPASQERLKNRIIKKREKGKELRLHYRLLIHDIIQTDDQFILVAEAYYPQYRSGTTNYALNGRYNDRIFDGYRFTHAIVCGFDKTGNLLWDNSFEIVDFSSYELEEVVQVNVEKDRLVLAYPQDGAIYTKVIKGSSILKNKENYKILTNFEHDKVVDTEPAKVAQWYNQYFLVWGFQKIGNTRDQGVKLERDVFYLNKIIYLNENDLTINN